MKPEKFAERMRAARELVAELASSIDDAGLDLSRLLHFAANLYEVAVDEQLRDSGLSGSRFGLLFWLLVEERLGNTAGISPTFLSHCQRVSKNTVSALLRGLEEQELIERALDQSDRRGFLIRLSDRGRELVREVAPGHLTYVSQMSSDLTPEERAQLVGLLEKLVRSLVGKRMQSLGDERSLKDDPHAL